MFYESAADKLKTAGVTVGCNPPTNDRHCGEREVTPGAMASFLVRALGLVDDGVATSCSTTTATSSKGLSTSSALPASPRATTRRTTTGSALTAS